MAFFFLKEYEAKVIVRSKLKYFSLIREKLNENRRILFRATCFGPRLDLLFFDLETHILDYILQKQGYVDDAHCDMPLIYHVDGRSLHFGRHEFHLITGFRFDLVGVLEDEELFGKLSDEDAVRVCLLLVLEVIFMGRLLTEQVDDKLLRLVDDLQAWNSFPWGEHIWRQLYNHLLNVVSRHRFQHLKGLEASSKFVPTYTLSGFVWAFKKLDALRKSGRTDKKYLPLVPRIEVKRLITEIGVKDCVIQKLNNQVYKLESIIQVLACERTCGFRDKLDFSRSFSHISSEFQEQLNREFREVVDTLISSRLSSQIHVNSKDDIVQYLLDEELLLREQEQEKWIIEEQKAKEKVFLTALKEEVICRVDREKFFKEAQQRKKARFNFFNSDHWQREEANMAKPYKRSHKEGSESSYYWSSKFVEAKKNHIDLWVEYMLHFRADDADWTMVTAYFVQLLLQDSIPVWYANGEKYQMTWGDVEQVMLSSGDKHDPEWRPWYLKMRLCLQLFFQLPKKLSSHPRYVYGKYFLFKAL
ncbi:phospholipase-like protein [Artemisia annua]|uniref:Phospholipase-like protein n=1 Tax=Artemisia annua TaxID=35608 RepID=A0A2U1L150_ARTAN|nr:phospholipase-like protein [Artemisia annua]